MNRFLRKLKDQLHFLDEKERDKIVSDYRKQIEKAKASGKSEREAVKSIGTIPKIVKKICQERNLNYEYCVRETSFEKNVNSISVMVANFIRDIIKIMRKIKLEANLEGFLEMLIKVIVLLFAFVILKLPFMLLDQLARLINRFVFYPFNDTFDLVTGTIISLAYLVVCVILAVKAFGNFRVRDRKVAKEEDIEKVDKEYNWLEVIIRVVIYIVVLLPLILLTIVDLFLLVESAYLVARGIDLIGIPIMLAGLFGLLCTLVGTIKDSMNHRRKSYLFAIFVSILVFITGIILTVFNFSKFKYPSTLDNSSIKAKTDEINIKLNEEDTKIYVNYGNYELLLDNNLEDNEIRAEVTYYDTYVDVIYDQMKEENQNCLVFQTENDEKINYANITENVVKDLKKGYVFNYSNVKRMKLKIYANDTTKTNLEEAAKEEEKKE